MFPSDFFVASAKTPPTELTAMRDGLKSGKVPSADQIKALIGKYLKDPTAGLPNPADFAKLAPGKQVEATVFVQGLNYWVGEVK